mgnify:CR=1 FL=1
MSEQEAILRKAIDQKIKITEGGHTKEISIQEAITRSQTAQALKGSPIAQRDVINRIDRLQAAEECEKRAREEAERDAAIAKIQSDADVFEYMVNVKKCQAKAWAEAKASGKDEPDFSWPHPDDIMIDEGRKQYCLRGPFSDEAVPLYRFMRAERDAALGRMARALVIAERDYKSVAKIWAVVVRSYDLRLPARWQIGEDWETPIYPLIVMTPDELEKEVDRLTKEAKLLSRLAEIDMNCRESYQFANEVMWPILDRQGYRSLAQFEEAYNATGGNPPWPRKRKQPEQLG